MFKKIASTFGIKVIIAFVNLAIVIILSRYTGAQGKGDASLIITTIAMVLLFCNMIGGSSLVYFVPRYNNFLLFVISNIWSVIVCGIAYVAFKLLGFADGGFIFHVILLSLINSLMATNLTILLGREKVMSNNYISLLQSVINFIVLWVLFQNPDGANIQSYVISLYAAMLLCLIISTVMVIPYLKTTHSEKINQLTYELVKLGMINQAGHVLKFTSFRVSYYILAFYSGDALGIFSNGTALVESVLLISNSFSAVLYPKIANSTDKKYTQALTLQMTRFSIIFAVAALIPLMLLPPGFWIWLFGSDFIGVQKVIILLAPGILLYNISLITGHYFSGTGKYRVSTTGNLLGLITTVILSLIVIPSYGIAEAGIISSVSYLVTTLFIALSFTKEAGIKPIQLLPTKEDLVSFKARIFSLIK